MNAEPVHNVALSAPTYRALTLVARIDRTTPQDIIESVVAAYLEGRLKAIREAQQERERERRGRTRVIDLVARRRDRRSAAG
jgi:hypothetical protein